LSPDTDPAFGSAATAAFGSGDDADYARAGTGSGHQAPVGAAHVAGNGSGPALSSAPARRGHGQHAARHGKGKPARRWRGSNTGKSTDQVQKAQTPTAQTPTSVTGSAVEVVEVVETSAADSRAPWERGDAR
jgi:hypothetical protein